MVSFEEQDYDLARQRVKCLVCGAYEWGKLTNEYNGGRAHQRCIDVNNEKMPTTHGLKLVTSPKPVRRENEQPIGQLQRFDEEQKRIQVANREKNSDEQRLSGQRTVA